MLNVEEVDRVAYDELSAGNVIITRDNDGGSNLAIVLSGTGGDHWAFELNIEGTRHQLDKDETFLQITVPLSVRFDPFSAIAPGETWPPSGTLLFLDAGPAIFNRRGPSTGRGSAIQFDGNNGAQYIGEEVVAFTRWTIGVERETDYVELLTFSVEPDDLDP